MIREKIFLFFLIVLSVLLYFPTLNAGFLSDDWDYLHTVETNSNPLHYLTNNIVGNHEGSSYGPMQNVFFIVMHALFGERAVFYHGGIIFLHVVVLFLIYFFTKRLTDSHLVAGSAALVFAVLPSHSEPIAWVAAFPHPLATALYLGGIYAYYHFLVTEKKSVYVGSLALLALAFFTKEIGLTSVGIVLLLEILFSREKRFFTSCKRLIAPVLLLVVFLWLRHYATGSGFGYYASGEDSFDFGRLWHTFVELFVGMVVSHPARVSLTAWFANNSIVAITSLITPLAAVFLFGKKWQRESLFFFLCTLFVTAPYVQLALNPRSNEGERYTYLISVFAILYLVTALWSICTKWERGKYVIAVALLLIMIAFGRELIIKNTRWQLAGAVVKNIIASYYELAIDPRDPVLFVGLPDHLDGAQVFRNAIQYALRLPPSKDGFDLRVPMYTIVTPQTATQAIVLLSSSSTSTYRLAPTSEPGRIFTGFREVENQFATFRLQQFAAADQSGTGIKIDLKPAAIDALHQAGEHLHLIYFTHGQLEQVQI